MINKEKFLKNIESNINNYGYHLTIVKNGLCPRFVYTIGMVQQIGCEIIFAGGLFYSNEEVRRIIDGTIVKLKEKEDWGQLNLKIESLGDFTLSSVDSTWSKLLILGAYDFYEKKEIRTIQILPDNNHYTLDIPKLSEKFNADKEPIWQFLVHEWNYPISKDVTVVTNLKVLFGEAITEIMRWEEDEWEMFSGAGTDVVKQDIRIVPIGTILGIDNSIEPALKLVIGKGIWRAEKEGKWNEWG